MDIVTVPTRGEKTNADITALLKARNTLLWVTTREETRVERALIAACGAAKYETRFWDCATGLTDATGARIQDLRDPNAVLEYIRTTNQRGVYVLRDLHKWLDPIVLRSVRSLARSLQGSKSDEQRTIIVLSPSGEIPLEWSGCTTVIDYPLPDRAEVARILADVISALPEERRDKVVDAATREAAIDAAVGLTSEEAANCYARSLVTLKRIDPGVVSSEKRRVIAREKVLTWHEPDPRGMDAVGGLDLLKNWLTARKQAFSPRAREYGLPAPKGALLLGPPGTGKSLVAKCIASAWAMPLLRLDMGALKSKWVGDSEANIRKALQVAESVSPCVLWLDEIEKALGGSTAPQGDGGVAADALGAILSWMQERVGSVFVIATANDVSALPPELLRKGRFDEIFFIDLPTTAERKAILGAALKQYKREVPSSALDRVAAVTPGFTGAELSAIVPDALFAAFGENEREITGEDLLSAAAMVVPLSKTASEKITALREWAKGRARAASAPEAVVTVGRAVDMGDDN